ncbi:unnamed protein product [Didymodactylos carnosus]|uniref:fructose-bisphosphate aldolase n=1 Tax=Didymodactylos carnosus TaxID=1234261 RepID=A0A8S2KDZ9_9BILA|nr:unnamed protein product [Didymodactylos carnosus]CAF3840838.1 unnamed protein product [Didymodactylos carnosus]
MLVFLDGGQSEDNATLHLNEMNKSKYAHKRPWKLTFSYGRALQVSALNAWGGNRDNETSAQQTFLRRAAANAKASTGEYEESTGR